MTEEYVPVTPENQGKRLTRRRAIWFKCLECCCESSVEVRLCHMTDCPLWRYRLGREVDDGLRPARKPRSSAQQRVFLGLSARKVQGVAGETAPKNDRVENGA